MELHNWFKYFLKEHSCLYLPCAWHQFTNLFSPIHEYFFSTIWCYDNLPQDLEKVGWFQSRKSTLIWIVQKYCDIITIKVQRADLRCDVTRIRLQWFEPRTISNEYSNFDTVTWHVSYKVTTLTKISVMINMVCMRSGVKKYFVKRQLHNNENGLFHQRGF